MREIKFNFVYGIDGEVERYFTRSFTFAQIEGCDHFDQICDGPLMKDCQILAKRQWSGIKDLYGVEIYEEDIANIANTADGDPDLLVLVEYHNGAFWAGCELLFTKDNIVVVGNSHQNPELLES